MPVDGLDGPCVRDESVPLDDPCADGQVKTIMKSRGYRKISGDICTKDDMIDFDPYEFTCCNATIVYVNGDTVTIDGHDKPVIIGLAVALALVIVIAMILGTVAVFFLRYVYS